MRSDCACQTAGSGFERGCATGASHAYSARRPTLGTAPSSSVRGRIASSPSTQRATSAEPSSTTPILDQAPRRACTASATRPWQSAKPRGGKPPRPAGGTRLAKAGEAEASAGRASETYLRHISAPRSAVEVERQSGRATAGSRFPLYSAAARAGRGRVSARSAGLPGPSWEPKYRSNHMVLLVHRLCGPYTRPRSSGPHAARPQTLTTRSTPCARRVCAPPRAAEQAPGPAGAGAACRPAVCGSSASTLSAWVPWWAPLGRRASWWAPLGRCASLWAPLRVPLLRPRRLPSRGS